MVEGLSTTAQRTSRSGEMQVAHSPATIRSIGRSVGRGALARSIQYEQLVLEQYRLCDHGTRSTVAEQLHQRSNQMD
jgi:hypothetical protein